MKKIILVLFMMSLFFAYAENISEQFDKSGYHIKTVEFIKELLSDPNSFEHIKTDYIEDENMLAVVTDFTTKNAYGGRVRYIIMTYCISGTGEVIMYEFISGGV